MRAAAQSPADLIAPGRPLTLAHVADGAEGLVLADLARAVAAKSDAPATSLLVVCRDGHRMAQLARALSFFAPDLGVLEFPAWDCLPYDRASPLAALMAQRMTALSRLAHLKEKAGPQSRPSVLLATVNAAVQRVPARERVASQGLSAAPGNMLSMDGIVRWLELNGFMRAATVREAGEYAVRGGIIDLYPPGADDPVRLDFFGDTLESIRTFDPESQRSIGEIRGLDLVPVAEFQLTTETIRRFRTGDVQMFGAASPDDLLYGAVSEGRRYPGMEHWLPLFHERMDTLFDYLPGTPVAVEPLAEDAAHERFAQIADYYEARRQDAAQAGKGSGPIYHALPPNSLYLDETGWRDLLDARRLIRVVPFDAPEGAGAVVDAGTTPGRNFAPERTKPDANVFDAVKDHVNALLAARKRVVFALWSDGARERMSHVLADHAILNLVNVRSWPEALGRPASEIALAVLGLESGFETGTVAVIGEQDILGDRLVRPRRASRRAENFIAEVSALAAGDLVVHVDHGFGRFVGLKTIQAAGAPHDCLEIHYAGNDKLFLPVENIELLSRYGSEDMQVELDRLGGAAWQARKARMKKRIREMAGELIKIAAERHLREAPRLVAPQGAYDEFCAGFPYEETEDQQSAIDAV
ncbi:MAG: transcription-repair coupling factor, partial [Alphaproteobacteria bacterium]|nr:transcription-repair coupling factor [Alphaproteobacteria bacterium]